MDHAPAYGLWTRAASTAKVCIDNAKPFAPGDWVDVEIAAWSEYDPLGAASAASDETPAGAPKGSCMSGFEHYEEELFEIDERIGRLAIACGVDLRQKDTIVDLIKGNYGVCKHGDNPKRQELRGLLMLKYRIEESCIVSIGTAECARLIDEEEAKLRRHGFRISGSD
ncbi:MAG: hypothetical protein ACHBNF_00270 [Chromatiales bacterium]